MSLYRQTVVYYYDAVNMYMCALRVKLLRHWTDGGTEAEKSKRFDKKLKKIVTKMLICLSGMCHIFYLRGHLRCGLQVQLLMYDLCAAVFTGQEEICQFVSSLIIHYKSSYDEKLDELIEFERIYVQIAVKNEFSRVSEEYFSLRNAEKEGTENVLDASIQRLRKSGKADIAEMASWMLREQNYNDKDRKETRDATQGRAKLRRATARLSTFMDSFSKSGSARGSSISLSPVRASRHFSRSINLADIKNPHEIFQGPNTLDRKLNFDDKSHTDQKNPKELLSKPPHQSASEITTEDSCKAFGLINTLGEVFNKIEKNEEMEDMMKKGEGGIGQGDLEKEDGKGGEEEGAEGVFVYGVEIRNYDHREFKRRRRVTPSVDGHFRDVVRKREREYSLDMLPIEV